MHVSSHVPHYLRRYGFYYVVIGCSTKTFQVIGGGYAKGGHEGFLMGRVRVKARAGVRTRVRVKARMRVRVWIGYSKEVNVVPKHVGSAS